jgi:hypothetical protein
MLSCETGHVLSRPLVGGLAARSRLSLVCAGGVIAPCSTGNDQPDLALSPPSSPHLVDEQVPYQRIVHEVITGGESCCARRWLALRPPFCDNTVSNPSWLVRFFSGKTVSLGEAYGPAVSLSARCSRDPRLMIPSPEEILC